MKLQLSAKDVELLKCCMLAAGDSESESANCWESSDKKQSYIHRRRRKAISRLYKKIADQEWVATVKRVHKRDKKHDHSSLGCQEVEAEAQDSPCCPEPQGLG